MSKEVRPDDVEALLAQFRASGLNELHLKASGFELFVSNDPAAAAPWEAAPASMAAPAAPSPRPASESGPGLPAAPPSTTVAAATPLELPAGHAIVRAPYLGHFYRAPKPGEPNFCEIGAMVAAEADICLVEVMKLFTAVRAGTGGIVRQVYAVDGQMVEEGQPLFAIEPVA